MRDGILFFVVYSYLQLFDHQNLAWMYYQFSYFMLLPYDDMPCKHALVSVSLWACTSERVFGNAPLWACSGPISDIIVFIFTNVFLFYFIFLNHIHNSRIRFLGFVWFCRHWKPFAVYIYLARIYFQEIVRISVFHSPRWSKKVDYIYELPHIALYSEFESTIVIFWSHFIRIQYAIQHQ